MRQQIRFLLLPLRRAAALLVLALALLGATGTARAAESLMFAILGSTGSSLGDLNGPRGVAVDSSGNIFVTDTGNNRLRKYVPSVKTWHSFGTNDITSSFGALQGIFYSSNDYKIYVINSNKNYPRILVYSPSTLTLSEAYATEYPPYGLCLDMSDQYQLYTYITTYLEDEYGELSGGVLNKLVGDSEIKGVIGSLTPSKAIAIDSSKNMYLVQHLDDSYSISDIIIKYAYNSSQWEQSGTLGSHGTGVGQFSDPHSLAVDTAGNLYVADTGNNRIQKYNVNTGTWTAWGGTAAGTAAGQFNAPQGIAVGSDGTVYVADTGNNRIQVGLTNGPAATLASAPASFTAKTSYSLTVNGTNATQYKYYLDVGVWSAAQDLSTPITLTDLSQGTHSLRLIGGTAQDYWQDTNAATVYYWTIKAKAQAVITNPPASVTALTSFSLSIGGTDVTQYQYRLDGGDWSDATSVGTPVSLPSLALGGHTLDVIGGDSEDIWQDTSSPTTATWEIRATPQATITNPPASATTQTSFSITIAGDKVTQYKYHLDTNDWSAATDVSTPIALSGLSSGDHTLYVLGSDGTLWQDTASPTTATWTENLPVAALTNAPGSPTTARSYSLTVGGSNVSQYKYRLDSGDWSAATDVATPITLTSLAVGSHTLDIVGGIDTLWQDTAAPSTYTWVIKPQLVNAAVLLLLQ